MSKYLNNYGLLNAKSESEGNFCENSALTTARYILKYNAFRLLPIMRNFIWQECFNGKYFNNLPKKEMADPNSHEADLNISADQLLGYALVCEEVVKEINEKLRFFFYNGRYIELKVWSYLKYVHKRGWFYKFLLKKACSSSVKKYKKTGETSGILKVWSIYQDLGWDFSFGVSIDEILKVYYEEDHPINTGEYPNFSLREIYGD